MTMPHGPRHAALARWRGEDNLARDPHQAARGDSVPPRHGFSVRQQKFFRMHTGTCSLELSPVFVTAGLAALNNANALRRANGAACMTRPTTATGSSGLSRRKGSRISPDFRRALPP